VVQRDDGETMFTPSAWVLTFKDGLVWRSRAYESVDAARAAYAEYGVDLDV
jgi:ketosteroid isomerase-like protein